MFRHRVVGCRVSRPGLGSWVSSVRYRVVGNLVVRHRVVGCRVFRYRVVGNLVFRHRVDESVVSS